MSDTASENSTADTAKLAGTREYATSVGPASFKGSAPAVSIPHRRDLLIVIALVVILWAPRITGPIDLRWDAGVYYLLGTSLASGHGYRIASEPGSPEALQYPPLLPLFVAACERVTGSADPEVIGQYLRIFYALFFLAYGLAILTLAKVYLEKPWALVATLLCLLQLWTVFLSDLLFAELPYALISVLFALALIIPSSSRRWWHEVWPFVLATAGFFLRTAGIVLLAAWIINACARRRWRLALSRAALAAIPTLAWHLHVSGVSHSEQYRHPSYSYQRAAYQNYNVPYAENMSLVDPFRPELGKMTVRQQASRFIRNLAYIPAQLGQAISAPQQSWQASLWKARIKGRAAAWLSFAFVLVLGLMVLAGFVILAGRRQWTLISISLLSVALMCLTPWPEEFHRYLMPVAPFLAIAALLGVIQLRLLSSSGEPQVFRYLTRSGPPALIGLTLLAQLCVAMPLLYGRTLSDPMAEGAHFYHGRDWILWEQAVAWLRAHAQPGTIVATAAPHQLYLRTGLRGVYPPFEADPAKARRELASVPVEYVIVDQFEYRDFSRHYALPAVENDPGWERVYADARTSIYQRKAQAKGAALLF